MVCVLGGFGGVFLGEDVWGAVGLGEGDESLLLCNPWGLHVARHALLAASAIVVRYRLAIQVPQDLVASMAGRTRTARVGGAGDDVDHGGGQVGFLAGRLGGVVVNLGEDLVGEVGVSDGVQAELGEAAAAAVLSLKDLRAFGATSL